VPFYFAYYHGYLYSFSTVGQKIVWMPANPLVCVEVDEVKSPHQWESVVVFGQYEELVDAPGSQLDRERAQKLLQQYGTWWEPGYAKTILHCKERRLEPIFYRIYIDRLTGHRATFEPAAPPHTELSVTEVGEGGGLQGLLRLLQGKLRGPSH
jgi:uncharacterized protein